MAATSPVTTEWTTPYHHIKVVPNPSTTFAKTAEQLREWTQPYSRCHARYAATSKTIGGGGEEMPPSYVSFDTQTFKWHVFRCTFQGDRRIMPGHMGVLDNSHDCAFAKADHNGG